MKNLLHYFITSFFVLGILLTGCMEDELPLPEPPSNLTATVISSTQIDLAWSDNSTSEDGFKIERKAGSEEFKVIETTVNNIKGYSDNNVMENISYTYRVHAFNSAHDIGEYSNEVIISTQIPVLSTTEITLITAFTAASGGTISDEGGSSVLSRGVVWDTSTNPTIDLTSKTTDGTGMSSFTSSIIGLNWETEYYVRAYATNSSGTSYGDEIIFTSEVISIATIDATEINHKAAISGGTIDGEGGSSIVARGVVWSDSPNPTISLATKTEDGIDVGNFTSSITELLPNSTYFVKAYASNSVATSYGAEVSFTTDNGIADYEGNSYAIVQIGTQLWMAENLKSTKYNDGNEIPLETDDNNWVNLSTPAYAWYNNDETTYGNTYGALYNWYAVEAGKLCPIGWHVPTNEDGVILTNYLGGIEAAGIKMKESGNTHWTNPNLEATNESGFTALPSGTRHSCCGNFNDIGTYFGMWSSTEIDADKAVYSELVHYHNNWPWWDVDKTHGFSARCLKD